VERVVCKNKKRVQSFKMETKWKSKNLKPATVERKIILKWILKIISYEGGLEYGKNMGSFLPRERLLEFDYGRENYHLNIKHSL